jgi:hypothetical protein
MTDTGGAFRLGTRSAKGLSSSMKGEPLNDDTCPYPVDVDAKSPPGGELIPSFVCLKATMEQVRGDKETFEKVKLGNATFLNSFRV